MSELLPAFVEFLKSCLFWTIVNPWQGAIHVRGGQLLRVLEPGWYLTVPVIDTVWHVDVLPRSTDIGPLPLVTRDGYNVAASAVVVWEVADVERFQTACHDAKEVLHDACSGELAHAVLASDWAEIPSEGFIERVAEAAHYAVHDYGLRVLRMRWTGVTQVRPIVVWTVGGHGGGTAVGGADSALLREVAT
jgi:regulator of protease activity HflC (stomatin/prohibitin superfamily)